MTTRSSRPVVNQRPQVVVSGNAAGSIGSASVRGGMPWADLGRGAAAVAEQQADYQIRMEQQRDDLAVNQALDQAQARASARAAELDPLSATYVQDTEAVFREEQDAARAGAQLKFKASTDRLNGAFKGDLEKVKSGALITQGKALDEQTVEQFTNSSNGYLNRIIQDPGSFDVVIDEAAAANLPLLRNLPQAMRDTMLKDFQDSAVLSLAQGLAEAGRYDEATKLLADQAGEIPSNKITEMRGTVRGIENRHRAEYLRDSAEAFANLELRVYGLGDGPPATRADIDAAKAKGAYTGREQSYVSHARIIKARAEAAVASENATASLVAAIGSPYGRQSDVDDRWDALVKTSLAPDASPNEQAALLRNFVTRQRAVPSFIQDRLAFAETATNPDELAAGAALFDQLSTAVPGIDTGLPQTSDIIALADQMRFSDQPAAQLASSLISRRRQLPADREGLELAWTTDRALLWNTENPIRQDLAKGLGIDADKVTAGMIGMYETTVKDVYTSPTGGDRTRARHAGLARVKERFAPSGVVPGGMTPYAPERALPPNLHQELDAQAQTQYIADALSSFGEAAGLTPGILPGYEPTEDANGRLVDASGLPPYALPADTRTQNELRQGARVTYPVRVRGDLGYVAVNVAEGDRAEAERILKDHPRLFLDEMGYVRYRVPGADEAENDPALAPLARDSRERRRTIFDRLSTWVSGMGVEGDDPTREAMEAIGPLVAP